MRMTPTALFLVRKERREGRYHAPLLFAMIPVFIISIVDPW